MRSTARALELTLEICRPIQSPKRHRRKNNRRVRAARPIDLFASPLANPRGLSRLRRSAPAGSVVDLLSQIQSAPGVTRTPDLRIRNPLLYPAELRAQIAKDIYRFCS